MDNLSTSNLLQIFCEAQLIDPNAFSRNYQNCYQKLIECLLEQAALSRSTHSLLVGISAPQGAGKSTLVQFFKLILENTYGLKVLTVSLDDFYKTRTQRQTMAANIHPLFRTRGVPGTHDTQLAISTLTALKNWTSASSVTVPWFNKALDDRGASQQNQVINAPIDIILFEGWCLNTKPQSNTALKTPVNTLEREYDPKAIWRTYVNNELGGSYQDLFQLIDFSITLYPPSFETICQWRLEQELRLINSLNQQKLTTNRTMGADEINHFMMHFERISRHHYVDPVANPVGSSTDSQRIQLDESRNTILML